MKALVIHVGLFIQRRLGWIPAIALLLAVTGAVAIAWALQVQKPAGPMVPSQATPVAAADVATPARQNWQVFVDKLPAQSSMGADLHHVFKLARNHGVELPKAEYLLQHDPRAPVVTIAITFPVKVSYGNTRAFVADVLNDLPHVALDELGMERGSAEEAEIGSRLKFTFMYRERP